MGQIVGYFEAVQSLLTTPLQIIIAVGALYSVVGWSALAGVGLMALMLALQLWSGRFVEGLQSRLMAKTDARVEKTQEVLQGIRAIKYFAWERPFAAELHDLRDQEMHALQQYWLVMSAIHVLYHANEVLVIFFTFFLFTNVAGHELDATTVFTVIALFNTLRTPMSALPDLAIQFFETRVSVRRVGAYLDGVDIANHKIDTSGNVEIDTVGHVSALPYIGAASATLSWSPMPAVGPPASPVGAATGATKDDTAILLSTLNSTCDPAAASTCEKTDLTYDDPPTQRFQLKDINFSAPRGKLTVVLGSTGSGKSMLLQALLGELALERGQVFMPHTPIASVPQQSWLLNATAKENVLFGAADEDPDHLLLETK
ncbi:hypothetical protein AMAG_20734 [Allomyces macrogynus ATCC 38327]|uniref:ABC transmembrane type-1 domain-containing protein n=1 Tax=Allomyces macrogynus (strain ATCC 38327) TaxID=578462 RepID=A0A0L0TF90_ALLM3|nr:hypothetical protein AMAG_20734 [Allomyces macrogynus ATCC 38327]|eukprot:KNE73269.1 hypothetical protein AMAG_20734 [Allomyces macrogynus ATCC 38327]